MGMFGDRGMSFPTFPKKVQVYDSAAGGEGVEDPVSDRASLAALQDVRKVGLGIALQLIDDIGNDDLDADELPSQRLDALMAQAINPAIVDDVADVSDVSDNELINQVLSANIADAFSSLGVDEGIVQDMFDGNLDVADGAIQTACEAAVESLPDQGDALDNFKDNFVYGFDADNVANGIEPEAVDGDISFDSANTSKKKFSFKGILGKKKTGTGNKRVKAKIKLTPKQKESHHGATKHSHMSSGAGHLKSLFHKK